jgi:hypothetical protein
MSAGKSITLYELAGQYRELEELQVSDDLPVEVLRDTLEGLTGDLKGKATNVAAFTRNLEASAETIEQAAEAMKARAAVLRRRAERVRHYLLFCLQAVGIKRIESPQFVIAVRSNPPAVRIAEGATVPAEYLVTPEPPPPHPDKRKLAEALKGGKVIDGVWLEATERLEIR